MLNAIGGLGDCVAAMTMFLAWWNSAGRSGSKRDPGWLLLVALFIGLAIEKILHLDTQIQEQLRANARDHGWYEDRRQLQIPVVVAIVLSAGIAAPFLKRDCARDQRLHHASLCGMVLFIFDAIRAVSLHQIDAVLTFSFGPIHLNYLIEGGLTATILFMAWPWNANREPRSRHALRHSRSGRSKSPDRRAKSKRSANP